MTDTTEDQRTPGGSRWRAVAAGLLGGAAGVAAMTATEKAEQAVTGRPPSFMPAHALQGLLRREVRDSTPWNWAMHWGQGAAVGVLRALLAERGVRGLPAWPVFTAVRLATDQAVENGTGVGTPPWTWSRTDLVVDVAHKAVYALVTGWVVDRALRR